MSSNLVQPEEPPGETGTARKPAQRRRTRTASVPARLVVQDDDPFGCGAGYGGDPLLEQGGDPRTASASGSETNKEPGGLPGRSRWPPVPPGWLRVPAM